MWGKWGRYLGRYVGEVGALCGVKYLKPLCDFHWGCHDPDDPPSGYGPGYVAEVGRYVGEVGALCGVKYLKPLCDFHWGCHDPADPLWLRSWLCGVI